MITHWLTGKPSTAAAAAGASRRDGVLTTPMDWLVEVEVECASCGELFPVTVDTSQGDYTTMDDCAVCCRPMQVDVRCVPGRVVAVETSAA